MEGSRKVEQLAQELAARWRPVPGQIALIEQPRSSPPKQCLTGLVTDTADGEVVIHLGASPRPSAELCSVVVSFFSPEALFRVEGVARTDLTTGVLRLSAANVTTIQRRSCPRLRASLRVRLEVPLGEGLGVSVLGETVDLAPGGCRVLTTEPLPAGVDPTVRIDMPGEAPVLAVGHVLGRSRWRRQWEYRLSFAHIDEPDARRLASAMG